MWRLPSALRFARASCAKASPMALAASSTMRATTQLRFASSAAVRAGARPHHHRRCHPRWPSPAPMIAAADSSSSSSAAANGVRGYDAANHIIWGVCNALPSVGTAAGAGRAAPLLPRKQLPGVGAVQQARSISTLRKRKKKHVRPRPPRRSPPPVFTTHTHTHIYDMP